MTADVHGSMSGSAGGRWWGHPRARSLIYQIGAVALVTVIIAYFAHNAAVNMARQGIAAGFGFLSREAGFEISTTLISYTPADTYGRALLVGLLNTLVVAAIGCVLTTIFGVLLGIARLSSNWLLRQVTLWYVEIFRNTPLLLQLVVWWDLLRISAPGPRQALQILPNVFVSNRGLAYPVPVGNEIYIWMLVAALIGVSLTILMARWAKRRQERTGEQFHTILAGCALILLPPLAVFLAGGAPLELDKPALAGFNFKGGAIIGPEFAALLFGLVANTSAFVAEIVRSGIQAVSWGQTEAAGALGLRRGQALRLVILPQAIRVIIPPMTSEYLSLTKNSSLAVGIGFADFVSVANTEMNQTGQAIEVIAILMAVYLTISLAISASMNFYNRFMALVER
ncbi:MAG TPA: amino acid ABC transporter permease [Stellaceae bacterium]|nr:amino acid ABC transporter permease [Stellaceae bacterium]